MNVYYSLLDSLLVVKLQAYLLVAHSTLASTEITQGIVRRMLCI